MVGHSKRNKVVEQPKPMEEQKAPKKEAKAPKKEVEVAKKKSIKQRILGK